MPSPSKTFERLACEFEVEFCEQALAAEPSRVPVMLVLANAYTAVGRHADGLLIDRKLAAALPDEPVVRYNLACSLSLTGHLDEALAELTLAVDLGYREPSHTAADPDLAALREDPRFRLLVERMSLNGTARKEKGQRSR
jgi:Flp pilus assembly protein TadD